MSDKTDKIINIFFGKFESPYIGSPFHIGGNQIYSAIIRTKGLKEAQSIEKVSHGIFHTIAPEEILYGGKTVYNKKDWAGHSVGEKINLDERHIKNYNDFFQLRSYNTPFIKDNHEHADFDRILRKHRFIIKNNDVIDAFYADRLSFFIVSDHVVELENIQLGAKRNLGFGLFDITNHYSFDLNSLDFSVFGDNNKLIETAKSGITGILNHSKYGYGEFKLEKWKDDKWLIKLTSPLCLESSLEGARHYDYPPPFMKSDNGYRKHQEYIWKNGKPERLYCVTDGSVFEYATYP